MPPLRRRRHSTRHSPAAVKYRRNDHRQVSGDRTASLSDDVLASIFARLSDTAAVVRCAATCRRWASVVATRAAVISGSLPPLGRFFPDLAVGVFHQENDRPTARGQHTALSSARPCFVATASGARFLGGGQHLLAHDGELLDHSCPVASRNGRLVLELRHEGRAADGLRFAVCNPTMMGDIDNNIILVPPLLSTTGKNKTTTRDYGCALLTGHDLRPPRCNSFFRLLLIYNRGRANSTVLRCYSSDTGCWGPEAQCIVKIPSFKIRQMGPAVVYRGVAFWALDQGLLRVRLDHHMDNAAAATDMQLIPFSSPHYWPNNRLLGVSPDNRLFFMYIGVEPGPDKIPILYFESLKEEEDDEDVHTVMRKWTVHDQEDDIPTKTTHHHTGIRLRWFGEKSGIVLFTTGEQSGDIGTFTFNLREKVLHKVVDDDGDSWKNLLGYEIDMAAYLASLARHRP